MGFDFFSFIITVINVAVLLLGVAALVIAVVAMLKGIKALNIYIEKNSRGGGGL